MLKFEPDLPSARFSRLVAASTVLQSTMGGHVDDAELDLSLPLVSLSLGLSAVFLFGGPTRDDPPEAIWLHSGDAIVVTGEARLCYHGVPRIMEGSCPKHLLDPERYTEHSQRSRDAAITPHVDGEDEEGAEERPGALAAGDPATLVEYLSSARININVRQLARVSCPSELARILTERSIEDTDTTAMSSVLGSRSVRRAATAGCAPPAAGEEAAVAEEGGGASCAAGPATAAAAATAAARDGSGP